VVFIDGKGAGGIKHGDYFGNTYGVLEVVKGTTLHLIKETGSKGTYSVVPVAYFSTKTAMSGNLLHTTPGQKAVHVARAMSLRRAGVPADATAAIITVTSPHANFTVGGVQVTKTSETEYVMVKLAHGAMLHTNAPHGAKVKVAGYAEPIHAIDDGSTLRPTYTQQLSGLLNLPTVF
jgi:hypothetical protein